MKCPEIMMQIYFKELFLSGFPLCMCLDVVSSCHSVL